MSYFIYIAGSAAVLFLVIIILQLASINLKLLRIGQIVALGVQKAGLVRTPEEAEEDARRAHEEEEETEGDVF